MNILSKNKNNNKKLQEKAFKNFNFVHHKAIPVEYLREFSDPYRFSIGTILICVYLAVFGYAFYYLYTENVTTQFVSFEEGDSSCTEVVKPLDGSFLASSGGNWEGDAKFAYSRAPIAVTFREMSSTSEYYKEILEKVKEKLVAVNEVFLVNNLATNMLYWTSFKTSVVVENKVQTFQLIGDPSYIFDSQVLYGGFSGDKALCPVLPTTTFNKVSASFEMSFPVSDYDSACQSVFATGDIAAFMPELLHKVSVTIDSRSFMTAMAINLGILNLETNYDFSIIDSQNITVDGVNYFVYQAMDLRYPGMDPIYCIRGSVCGLKVGSLLTLPVFDHFGTSGNASEAQPCKCSSAAGSNNDWCHTFDFLLGLVNFDRAFVMNSSSYVSTHKYIRNQYHSSYSAFNADWAQVVRTLIADPTTGVQEIKRKNVTASIISMRSLNFDSSIISDYAYALKEGFCSGTLDATLHNWDKLAATPPATLVEPYLKCYRSKWFSFLDAAGVSMADCDLLMRSAAYTLLPLIYLLLKYFTGFRMVAPAETTLETFAEVLHKAKEESNTDEIYEENDDKEQHHLENGQAAVVASTTTLPSSSLSPSKKKKKKERARLLRDRKAAAEITRLLAIALDEEVEAHTGGADATVDNQDVELIEYLYEPQDNAESHATPFKLRTSQSDDSNQPNRYNQLADKYQELYASHQKLMESHHKLIQTLSDKGVIYPIDQ